MNPTKPTVAEDKDDIVVFGFALETRDDGIDVGLVVGGLSSGAKGLHHEVGVESLAGFELIGSRDGGDTDGVGLAEGFREGFLENVPAGRV